MNDRSLWQKSQVRLQFGESIVARLPIYGVPFKKALDLARKEKYTHAVFYILPDRQKPDHFYSQLLLKVSQRKESNGLGFSVECWQWIGVGVQVHYAHMITSSDGEMVSHVDGATMAFDSETDIMSMFSKGEKQKGKDYQKYFRVDADKSKITITHAVELIRLFFPIRELVNEAFEHSSITPPSTA